MKHAVTLSVVVSLLAGTNVMAQQADFVFDDYVNSTFTGQVLAQASSNNLPDFDKLNETENRYQSLMAQSKRNKHYSTVSKYTTIAVAIAGVAVAVSNTEKNSNGDREFNETGQTGLGVAMVGGIIGSLITSYYSDKSAALASQAEKLSQGVSYDANTQAFVYRVSYQF